MSRSVVPLLVVVALAVSAGCGGSSPKLPKDGQPAPTPSSGGAPWPAPPNPLELARKAGLTPEPEEQLLYHVHAHLDVFVNGEPVSVPAGIGIDIHDPAVHSAPLPDGTTAYGGISTPCAQPCISPLHTHDVTGILHTESATPTANTLGQFFIEWAVPLTNTCVGGYCQPASPIAIYVNGQLVTGDPRSIALLDHTEIAIVIGRPPAQVPATADWSKA